MILANSNGNLMKTSSPSLPAFSYLVAKEMQARLKDFKLDLKMD